MNGSLSSTCRRAHRHEGANLEPALAGIGVDVEVVVVEEGVTVVAAPAIHEMEVPLVVDPPGVGRGRPVRDAAGADDCDLLGHGIGRPAERLAEGPGPVERRERRTLTIDVDRDNGKVEPRGEEVEWHRDAVVEQPLLGVRDVDGRHDLGDQPLRQVAVARSLELVDAEPARILDRAVVEIGHADGEARHVVHEEVGEVFGRDDDDRLGPACFEIGPHVVERRVEGVAHLEVGEVLAAGNPGGVAAHTRVDERHQMPPSWPSDSLWARVPS